MLIKVIDHKDDVYWVNPAYVRGLIDKGKKGTVIDVSGWSSNPRVNVPVDEVAGLVNLVLERMAGPSGAMIAEQAARTEEDRQAQEAAVMAAVVIGG